jgi:hypothetical protein
MENKSGPRKLSVVRPGGAAAPSLPLWKETFWLLLAVFVVVYVALAFGFGQLLTVDDWGKLWLIFLLYLPLVVVAAFITLGKGFSRKWPWCVKNLSRPSVMWWSLYGVAAAWFTAYLFFPWDSFIPFALLGVLIGGALYPAGKKFGGKKVFVWSWTISLMVAALGFVAWLFSGVIGFHPWRDNPLPTALAVLLFAAVLFGLSQKWGWKNVLGWTWSIGAMVAGVFCVVFIFRGVIGLSNEPSPPPAPSAQTQPGEEQPIIDTKPAEHSGGIGGLVIVLAVIGIGALASKFASQMERERIDREAHETDFSPIGTKNPLASSRDLKDRGYND